MNYIWWQTVEHELDPVDNRILHRCTVFLWKNKLFILSKTKQKDDFIIRHLPCKSESECYGSNGFRVASRLRDFYGINTEVTWLFHLIGCLVVFFLTWIWVAELGIRKSREWTDLVFDDWLMSSTYFWEEL